MGCVESQKAIANLTSVVGDSFPACTNYVDCQQLQQLREVLEYYSVWISQLQQTEGSTQCPPSQGIFEYMDTENNMKSTDSYSIRQLLSDYHHLLSKHCNEFEDIYDAYFSAASCDMQTCRMMSRNHRDRTHTSQLYFNSKWGDDNNEVIAQQLLDQMHCYLYHSYDMGFKLRRQQIEMEEEMEDDGSKQRALISGVIYPEIRREYRQRERIARIIQEKKTHIPDSNKTKRKNSNKFMTCVHEAMAVEKKTDNGKHRSHTSDSMFSFGVRFYYNEAKYAKNDALDVEYNYGYKYSDWFVRARHRNLQRELLDNDTHRMGKRQFNDLYHKAKYYLEAEFLVENCRHMKIKHLMAIMTYCNFDGLQRELTKTYRHTLNESDEQLKKRHSEFAHLGRTLQDAVELNGTRVQKGDTKTFYHGINVELMFTSTLHKFCAPISTSSEYAVALLFTKKNGIILELNDATLLSDESESIYFDCQYISDFTYEKEKFFIGGMVPLKIVGLFHVKLNENYGAYIKLITILLSIIEGNISSGSTCDDGDLAEHNQEAIVRLLKHEMGQNILEHLPHYISRLLHHICLNIELITTRYSATFGSKKNEKKYHILADFLCSKECSLFQLDLLKTLFPNLTSIALECSSLTHRVFENIVDFLRKHESTTNLSSIVFQAPVSPSLSFNAIQKLYALRLTEFHWSLHRMKKSIVLKKDKTCEEDRKASTNVLNSHIIFQKTEQLMLQRSLSVFYDDKKRYLDL